jgi:hypothetical protein
MTQGDVLQEFLAAIADLSSREASRATGLTHSTIADLRRGDQSGAQPATVVPKVAVTLARFTD